MRLLIEAIGFGIVSGSLIALGAVGFTVQFGVSNVLNITYGSLMTVAAFIADIFLINGINIWVALFLVSLIISVASFAFNRLLLAPMARRNAGFVAIVITTVSVAIALQYITVAIFGAATRSLGIGSGGTLKFADFVFTGYQLVIVGIAVVAMGGLHLLLTRTKLGKAMRATSINRTLAQSCGIQTARVTDVSWLLSGLLCGAAGVALAMTLTTFDYQMGLTFLVYMIAAAVMGGIGQPYGAMAGGLVVGIVSQIAGAYLSPAYEDVIAFAILILMLLTRPRGFFGGAQVTAKRLVH